MFRIQDPDLEKMLHFLARQDAFVFLDTTCPDYENIESLLFLEPVDRLLFKAGENLEDYLTLLQDRLANGYYLAGWVGYEFGVMLEDRIVPVAQHLLDRKLVLADLGVFLEPCRFDHLTGKNSFPFGEIGVQQGGQTDCSYTISDLVPNMTKEEFVRVLADIQNYIAARDTYQVNSTMKLLFDLAGSPEALYSELRKNQMVSYSAYIRNSEERILSFSPELFLRKTGDEFAARPMKGTTSKGRVKAKGSEEMMSKLKFAELFRALFPCGSITGAPRTRTMQIIDELEKEQRGVHTGAIGYLGPDGTAVFNMPIQTIRLQGNSGEMGICAEITNDSVPEQEWEESLLKGRFLTHVQPEFQLFETILWQPGAGYWLLEEHLARLADGAKYFKFSLDLVLVRKGLKEKEKNFTAGSCYRLRLVLAKDGQLSFTAVECDSPTLIELPPKPNEQLDTGSVVLPVVDFSSQPVEVDIPWRFHKTTRRQLYNEQYVKARQEGLFDYLFCNGEGEVTEGCITNLVVYLDGRYVTPPVNCGLLPGVMRGKLLADRTVPLLEKVLTPEDVRAAEAVFVCNSVRGLVRVQLKKVNGQ